MGLGSGVNVVVGGGNVAVLVGVGVSEEVGVGVISMMTSGVVRRAKYTMIAPMAKNKANNPMAAGRLIVILGIRLPCTALGFWAGFSALPRSAPHTRQRVASSDRRVPQVGHNLLEGDVVGSGLIFYRLNTGS